jgi:DNA-binding FadR family transcriptional regulator
LNADRAASPEIFQSLRGQSLSARIVEQVIDALFAKKLKAGEFFGTEAQLADMFQTSRVPIREALGRLEALGVVNIKTGAGGGATIAQGAPDRFAIALAIQFMLVGVTSQELFDARIAIECRGAELAASHITADELAGLRALYEQIGVGEGGQAAFKRILAFHSAIVDASRSRTLITLMHALETALLNLYIEALPADADLPPRKDFPSLKRILERLEAHDGEGAFQAMRQHLVARQDSILADLAAAEKKA